MMSVLAFVGICAVTFAIGLGLGRIADALEARPSSKD